VTETVVAPVAPETQQATSVETAAVVQEIAAEQLAQEETSDTTSPKTTTSE
jgi:hypothetical protein